MRAQLRLGALHYLETMHRTKQWTWLKGGARDGRLMGQKPENIMRPFSPCTILVEIAPIKVLVCVTVPLLKIPAYLAKLAARRSFYAIMREIYYKGVVPSSVQLFRKGNFDSEDHSTITGVILLVSEAQGGVDSKSTKRMEIACCLSLHVLY